MVPRKEKDVDGGGSQQWRERKYPMPQRRDGHSKQRKPALSCRPRQQIRTLLRFTILSGLWHARSRCRFSPSDFDYSSTRGPGGARSVIAVISWGDVRKRRRETNLF